MMKNDIILKNFFIIKWQSFTACNYNCSFCCQNKKNSFDFRRVILDASLIKERIIEKINDQILISVSGGELSILKIEDLIKVLEKLKSEKIKYIYITSNFSNTSEYYNKINDWCKKNNIDFLLEISFHEKMVSEEIFFCKIKQLEFKPIAIQTVVTEENYLFMQELKSRHSEITFEPNIYDDISKIKFDFKSQEKFRYNQRKENIFFQKKCLQNQISIKENGDIYNNNCKLLKYGNLHDKFYLPPKNKYFICTKKACNNSHLQEII